MLNCEQVNANEDMLVKRIYAIITQIIHSIENI